MGTDMSEQTAVRLRLEYMKLEDLREFPSNPKKHDLEEIAHSAEDHGFNDPVAINEATGSVIEGNGRREMLAARKAGGAAPPRHVVVDPESGSWLVPVIRGISFPTDDEAEAYLLAHNEIGRRAGYEPTKMGALLERLQKRRTVITRLGLGKKEINRILRKQRDRRAGQAAEEKLAGAQEIAKRWQTEEGQLWEIPSKSGDGSHHVVIGDSFVDATVDRAIGGRVVATVATDPPYAIYGSSTGVASDVADDAMVRPFFEAVLRLAVRVLPWFGAAHICCDWRSWPALHDAARRSNLSPKNLLVWDKGDNGLGSNYANCYELIGYLIKVPPQGSMKQARRAGIRSVMRPNLQRFARPVGDERLHNAAKPIGLMMELIQNTSEDGELVLDPFGGSGTTLLAAERASRLCAMVEKSPQTAALILERAKGMELAPRLIKA